MRVKGKFPTGRLRSRLEQEVRNNVTSGKKEVHGKKLSSSYKMTDIYGQAWLSDDP
jgi:hypothetical protein